MSVIVVYIQQVLEVTVQTPMKPRIFKVALQRCQTQPIEKSDTWPLFLILFLTFDFLLY